MGASHGSGRHEVQRTIPGDQTSPSVSSLLNYRNKSSLSSSNLLPKCGLAINICSAWPLRPWTISGWNCHCNHERNRDLEEGSIGFARKLNSEVCFPTRSKASFWFQWWSKYSMGLFMRTEVPYCGPFVSCRVHKKLFVWESRAKINDSGSM